MNEENENEDNQCHDDEDGNEEVEAESIEDKGTGSNRLIRGKHYYVFIFQTWTNKGPPICFIAARYCVAKFSHQWIRRQLEYIESALAFYGFVVCSEGNDGATENRSYTLNRCTLTFGDLCGNTFKRKQSDQDCVELGSDLDTSDSSDDEEGTLTNVYGDNELPWNLPIAFKHPSVEDAIIIAGGDGPHALKKMRNAMDLSGHELKKRDLHLNGLPVSLRMLYDIWRRTPDAAPHQSSELMRYPKLKREVFVLSAKSRMRTYLAARAQSLTIMQMVQDYKHLNSDNAAPGAYDSVLLHCTNTDLWFDVLNANSKKGCELIDSSTHRHIFDLLNYAKYHTIWDNQTKDEWQKFPKSTIQDVLWTSLGIVVLAVYYLPKHPGHAIVQSRHGSDKCEETFCLKRNANPNADKLGTDQILASCHGGPLMNMFASKKANFKKRKVFFPHELQIGKIKRLRLDQK